MEKGISVIILSFAFLYNSSFARDYPTASCLLILLQLAFWYRPMKISSGHIIKALAVYSFCVITAISFLFLTSDEADIHQKAIIKMALGLVLFWIVIGGTLMYRFRKPISHWVRDIPLNWRVKFILFATALALLDIKYICLDRYLL